MTDLEPQAGHIIRRDFTDPITDRTCTLVIDQLVELWQGATVEHPDCDHPADVSMGLDCFYCTECRWNGRISGAWVNDLAEGTT